MKKYIFLIAVGLIVVESFAQHKSLTVYYGSDSSKVVDLTNSDSLVIFICGASKVNYGGKAYNTVLISNQCWLKENLDIGTMISGNSDQLDNSILEKYCYNNNPENCITYGGLYQWDEAMQYVTTEGAKGICPTGWYIPTLTEYIELFDYVVWDGKALLAIGQGQGTNTSGFSALLAGYRNSDSHFYYLGNEAVFWISTEYNVGESNHFYLSYNLSNIILDHNYKKYGFSVRCLKN